ncbi:MAG TPA: hypothetical protein PKK63_00025 [Bacillota bacterium]|nr:hypothetical protein [Bacillota bacterium]
MRRYFAIASILVVAAAIGISGCKGTWGVDFTTAKNIDDWYSYGDYDLGASGLSLDNLSYVESPVRFSGNFTLVLTFELITAPESLGHMELFFTDGETYEHETWVYFDDIASTGNVTFEVFEIDYMGGSEMLLTMDEPFENLLRNDVNELTVEKVGIVYKFYLNGTLVQQCEKSDYYDSEYYNPSLYSEGWDRPSDGVVYKSITVDYDGRKLPAK